jgi:hypothetical protein
MKCDVSSIFYHAVRIEERPCFNMDDAISRADLPLMTVLTEI